MGQLLQFRDQQKQAKQTGREIQDWLVPMVVFPVDALPWTALHSQDECEEMVDESFGFGINYRASDNTGSIQLLVKDSFGDYYVVFYSEQDSPEDCQDLHFSISYNLQKIKGAI